jgi:hypothetical protein
VLIGCAEPRRLPDVLLVTVDTLRADALGAFGGPDGASPNLDALAGESAVFLRALAASAATAPSHASLFTGHFVRGHSVGARNADASRGRYRRSPTRRRRRLRDGGLVSNILLRRQPGSRRASPTTTIACRTEANRRPRAHRRPDVEAALAWLAQPHDSRSSCGCTSTIRTSVHRRLPMRPAGRAVPGEMPLPVLRSQYGLRGIPSTRSSATSAGPVSRALRGRGAQLRHVTRPVARRAAAGTRERDRADRGSRRGDGRGGRLPASATR